MTSYYFWIIKRHSEEREALPESTGWILFKSIEQASSGDRSATAAATSSLSVKMYARRPLRNRKSRNNTNPMTNDVRTVTTIENFAALELPLPSSFDTLTLEVKQGKKNLFNTHHSF